MANVGNKGIVRYEETLAIKTVGTAIIGVEASTQYGTEWGVGWICSMDTGGATLDRAVNASRGLHLAGSIAATDDLMVELAGDQLMFYGQTGFSAVECLLQLTSGSSVAVNFGFHDTVLEGSPKLAPVSLATSTWAATASAFIGLVKDFDATNDEFHCFWCDDDVDTTENLANLRMRGMSLTAGKWCWLRVEMQDRGSGKKVGATFHVAQDGKHATKEFVTSVSRDQAFCWYLAVENRAAIARGVYVKLPAWEQSIAD